MSDVSDDKLDGMTTPQGPAARGRTHPSGIFTGSFSTQGSISPPVTGHPATGQLATGHPLTEKEIITSQLVTSQPVNQSLLKYTQVNQSSVTGHPIDYQAPDISQLSPVNQSPLISQIIRLQFAALMLLALSAQQITNQIWVLNTHLGMNLRTQLLQDTQEEYYYPWNWTSAICPIPILS